MNEEFKIYRYNLPDGKVYIGSTTQPLKHRQWAGGNSYRDTVLWPYIVRYGAAAIFENSEILYTGTEDRWDIERYFTLYYGTDAINEMKGSKHSDKTKAKMSEHHRDVSGSKNPMFGVHRHGSEAPGSKPIIAISDSDMIEMESATDLARYLCCKSGAIYYHIKTQTPYKNYHIKYKNI